MLAATKPKYRDITFEELDFDDERNEAVKGRFNVDSIPRLIFLDGSGQPLYNGGAPQEEAALEDLINRYR